MPISELFLTNDTRLSYLPKFDGQYCETGPSQSCFCLSQRIECVNELNKTSELVNLLLQFERSAFQTNKQKK